MLSHCVKNLKNAGSKIGDITEALRLDAVDWGYHDCVF